MELQAEIRRQTLSFVYLPAYAQYLLEHKLDEFVQQQFHYSYEERLHLLQLVRHLSPEEQLEISRIYNSELLRCLAENRADEHIANSLDEWKRNGFPFDKYTVITDDIVKVSFIRKRSFLHFLPEYCEDGTQMIRIVGELDRYFLHLDSASLDVFTQMIEEQAAERTRFIEKVNATVPGALYIFDLERFQNLYANDNFQEVIGYSREELNELATSATESLLHPEDREVVRHHLEAIRNADDGDILSFRYRLLRKNGQYRWYRNYESPFRRDASGKVSEVIAICQDVHREKTTAEQLRQREEQLLEAQSIAHIGSFYWVLDGDLATRTPELDKILETSDDDLDFFKRVAPEDLDRVRTDIKKALETGVFDSTYRYLGSGGVKHLWSRGIVHYRNGSPYALSGTVLDVTERTELLLQAAENERLYKQVEALANMGTWYWDANHTELQWTDNLYRIYGLEPQSEPMTAERFLSFVHPDDRAPIEASIKEGYPESVADHTFRIVRPDGVVRTLHSLAQVVRDADGKLVRVFGTEKDITGEIEAERRIEEQDYFIQHLADASPMVLYLFDIPTGRFHYLNREIFYVLGYTPEEVLSLDADATSALYHPDDLALLPERSGSESRFHYQESMMQYECRMRRKDGGWYWLLAREIVFRKDEQGNVQQILGAALDINRRKEMERALLQNSFQLEQSNASLEEFAYVASHDLKEPLRKISTFGDRLVASQIDRLTDDGKIYLKKVVDASQRMQAMIDDLLSVSRISGNRGFERVSLNDLFADALQALEFKIEQAGATIHAEPLPEAEVVPSQFRQLFQNLLSNSLKFAREQVAPVIDVRYRYLRPEQATHLQLRKAPQYLEIRFRDNGIGFEKEYSNKIFQIFQRLHGRSEYEGNGIGLAIVKKIVEHHGGAIQAEGDPGNGAEFTLTLPL